MNGKLRHEITSLKQQIMERRLKDALIAQDEATKAASEYKPGSPLMGECNRLRAKVEELMTKFATSEREKLLLSYTEIRLNKELAELRDHIQKERNYWTAERGLAYGKIDDRDETIGTLRTDIAEWQQRFNKSQSDCMSRSGRIKELESNDDKRQKLHGELVRSFDRLKESSSTRIQELESELSVVEKSRKQWEEEFHDMRHVAETLKLQAQYAEKARAVDEAKLSEARKTIKELKRDATCRAGTLRDQDKLKTIIATLEAKNKAYQDQICDAEQRARAACRQVQQIQGQKFALELRLQSLTDCSSRASATSEATIQTLHQTRDTLLAILNETSNHVQQYLGDLGGLRAEASAQVIEDNVWNALSQSAQLQQVCINALRIVSEISLRDPASDVLLGLGLQHPPVPKPRDGSQRRIDLPDQQGGLTPFDRAAIPFVEAIQKPSTITDFMSVASLLMIVKRAAEVNECDQLTAASLEVHLAAMSASVALLSRMHVRRLFPANSYQLDYLKRASSLIVIFREHLLVTSEHCPPGGVERISKVNSLWLAQKLSFVEDGYKDHQETIRSLSS